MAPKKILIVEDEGIVAKDIERALSKRGYEITGIASTGEAALAQAADVRPDLVLMDIVLKGEMDGVEAAQGMRQQYGVPVVYLTALGDPKTLQRATATSPYGYMLKPFEDRDLYDAVEWALFRDQMERDLRSSTLELAAVLNSAFDGIIITDKDGRITVMNAAASVLTGWSHSKVVGKDWADVFRITEPLPSDLASLATAVLLTETGRRIPVEHRTAPMIDARGNVDGAVLAFHPLRSVRSASSG
jgi:PAS domain S-box-containing protein